MAREPSPRYRVAHVGPVLVDSGPLIALFNAGGYGSASSSNHCMRGSFSEHLLD